MGFEPTTRSTQTEAAHRRKTVVRPQLSACGNRRKGALRVALSRFLLRYAPCGFGSCRVRRDTPMLPCVTARRGIHLGVSAGTGMLWTHPFAMSPSAEVVKSEHVHLTGWLDRVQTPGTLWVSARQYAVAWIEPTIDWRDPPSGQQARSEHNEDRSRSLWVTARHGHIAVDCVLEMERSLAPPENYSRAPSGPSNRY